jgi:O-antigen/teichoic acid export membrane protein
VLRASRLARNLAFLVGGEASARLLSFVAVAYLARLLGTEGFGLISFAGALVGYFGLGVNPGLDLIGTRQVARRPETLHRTVVTIQSLRLVLAGLAYAALAAVAAALPLGPEARRVVLLTGLTLPAIGANLGWAFQGTERMAAIATATVSGQAVLLAGVLLVVGGREQLLRVPLLQVAAEVTAATILLVLFTHLHGLPAGAPDRAVARASLRETVPLFSGRAMRALAMSFDVLTLRFYLGDASVGVYAASSRILLFLLSLAALYFTNLYPTLSRAVNWEKTSLQMLVRLSLRFTALVGVGAGVGGFVLAAPLITSAFGDRYAASVVPFRLHIIALTLMILAGNYRTLLLAFGHQGTDTRIVASGALLNVLLNLVLVPRLGPTGAAIAFLATEATILVLSQRAVGRLVLSEPLARHLIRPLAAAGAMAIGLLLIAAAPLLTRIGLGAAIYAGTVLAFRATSVAELRAVLFRAVDRPLGSKNVDG